MAQAACTPLHRAAHNGHEAAIKALVVAKADVHANAMVNREVLGGREGGRRRVCMLLLLFGVLNLGVWNDQICKPQTQFQTLNPGLYTLTP